jgi:MoxR-like ATPase
MNTGILGAGAGMHDQIQRLRENIGRVYFGQPEAVDRVICCLLARGHLLIEDVPGVGKTVLATALARSLDCSFSRIQLTPDLLPSDILGVEVYDREAGTFTFRRGPIFANVVLADEINRTPPRTQAALLEAMNEATVSMDGRVIPLESPFMVIATQNPFDFEGTYALPENQLDRFLMRVRLGYPSATEEARVLEVRPSNSPLHSLGPVLSRGELLGLQEAVSRVKVDAGLLHYVVLLANRTRAEKRLLHGLSPRGSLALAQAARAWALMAGREYVVPEDILANIGPVCEHRVIARAGSDAGIPGILREVVQSIPAPG